MANKLLSLKQKFNKETITIENISNKDYLSDSDIESGKFYGNIHDFSVDYEQISKENILKIHTYLMKKMVIHK